jgi:hypothetical protein
MWPFILCQMSDTCKADVGCSGTPISIFANSIIPCDSRSSRGLFIPSFVAKSSILCIPVCAYVHSMPTYFCQTLRVHNFCTKNTLHRKKLKSFLVATFIQFQDYSFCQRMFIRTFCYCADFDACGAPWHLGLWGTFVIVSGRQPIDPVNKFSIVKFKF